MSQPPVRLDEIISYITNTEGTAPDQVSADVRISVHLGDRDDRVLPEHLTLGMLHVQEGLAARAIAAIGVSPDAARAAIDAALPAVTPDRATPEHVPFDSRAMKVLELTLREALALGHNYIG